MRVGTGFDVHPFADDDARSLILGGVRIDGHRGLVGHSDADVIAHSITDAVLGAAGLGDMGEHFPDTDPAWKNSDSIELLRAAVALVEESGMHIVNIDCTVVTEQPAIKPHKRAMEASLTKAANAPVNVKASRAEKLGAIGRVEGAACWSVVLLDS